MGRKLRASALASRQDKWLEKIAKELAFTGRMAADGDSGFEDMDVISRSVQIAFEALEEYELRLELVARNLPGSLKQRAQESNQASPIAC